MNIKNLLWLAAAAFMAWGCSTSDNGNTTDPVTTNNGSCPGTTTLCSPQNACFDLMQDAANCGECGNVCRAGQSCVSGQCMCPAGQVPCATGCADLTSDPNNCGQCNLSCGDMVCNASQCAAGCGAGLSNCGGACVDLNTSTASCGTCGTACAAGQSCTAGSCACPAGGALCGSQCCAAGQVCDTATNACVVPGAPGMPSTPAMPSTPGMPSTPTTDPTAMPTNDPTNPVPTDTMTPPGDMPPGDDMTPDNPGGDPAGFWRQDDWYGCVWTGVDDLGVNSAITPQDFTSGVDGAYCVDGTVGPSYNAEGVALLGFNLAQDPATADCTYVPVDPDAEGPPGVTLTGSGIAFDFAKTGNFILRVQIQGPNGAADPEDRWCATIEAPNGKDFIEWDAFNTECWSETSGTGYAGQEISAVVFTVPGDGWGDDWGDESTAAEVDFSFCVNGFAAGETAADAPDGTAVGTQSGTIGGDDDFDRVKVRVDGKDYVIQNNAWGDNAAVTMSYENNSFTVDSAAGSGDQAPASFPSIFIGANGFTDNGALSTTSTDNLPVQISNITSIPTTFRWSGNNGNYNAAYDVWFANMDPAGRRYNDGLNAFLMVWVKLPDGKSPIGNVVAENVPLGGHTWTVWSGPRSAGPGNSGGELTPDGNAPVVSYLKTGSALNSFSFDLKEFIDEAVSNGRFGASGAQLYLTDVFAGFEIWNGGTGLAVDEFTADVNCTGCD